LGSGESYIMRSLMFCSLLLIKYSGCQSEKNDIRGQCSTNGGRIFGGKPLGKNTTWCRWMNNIKIDLQEVECRSIDWIDTAQDRDRWRALANAVMKLQVQ